MKKIFLTLALTLFLGLAIGQNCAIAKQKAPKPTEEEIKTQYLNLTWWDRFNDEKLSNYIKELYTQNKDLKIAALKVKEGEKIVKASLANELPHVGFDGSLGRIMKSSNTQYGDFTFQSYAQNAFLLPLTASYEIDIWGTNRFKTKSIEKELEMIKEDERATYIALTSSFASEYFNLIKINKLIDIQKEIVKTQEEIVDKTIRKHERGLFSENEVLNEKKALTTSRENLNNFEKAKHILENQLKSYLANSNKTIDVASYENITIPDNIPESFTSDAVENRPDFKRQESYIRKIGCDVSVAKREFLPKFLIYGQIGFNAYDWGNIFKSYSQLANAGILPSFDLFAGGKKIAIYKLKKYEYEEALEQYQKTILNGIQEINDTSVIYQATKKNYLQNKERANLEARKFELIQKKNQIGAASNYDVLYDKKQDLITQKEEVSAKINSLISIIGLYKALGGKDIYSLNTNI